MQFSDDTKLAADALFITYTHSHAHSWHSYTDLAQNFNAAPVKKLVVAKKKNTVRVRRALIMMIMMMREALIF